MDLLHVRFLAAGFWYEMAGNVVGIFQHILILLKVTKMEEESTERNNPKPCFKFRASANNSHVSRTLADVVTAAVANKNGQEEDSECNGCTSQTWPESVEPQQDTAGDPQQHQSRRNTWIKKRWKAAFHTVRAIGNWTRLDEVKRADQDLESPSSTGSKSLAEFIAKKKWHVFMAYYPQQRATCAACGKDTANDEETKTEQSEKDTEEEEDGACYVKCQQCPVVVHENCVNSYTAFCQGQKQWFPLRKQKSITPADEYARRRFSLSAEGEDDQVGLDNVGPSQIQQSHPTVVVDPIYLALKEANRMATTRRVSVASSPSPVGLNACSPRDLTPSDSMKELTANRPPWGKMASSASATSGSSSGYGSNAGTVYGTKSLRNSPARMQSVSSTPSLTAQKSTESQEGGTSADFRRSVAPSAVASAKQRRPPKLGSKMKSLSLDCPDAKVRSKGSTASGYSPVGRRVLRVRPCKNSSFDASDDGADPSSTSCSPCQSPYCGSTLVLPSSSYAVTHDYHAKFPEEIDLGVGERVFVFETGDPDWWQGQNVSGRIGIFPSTCVAHIHSNERIMQVVQNLNLWDGSKSLRLYRDQIVFAQQVDPDGLVEIRTERDHRINCPIQYLMRLD